MVDANRRTKVYRYYFTGRLLKPADDGSIEFTLKFRTSSSDDWQWVNDNSSLKNGLLCFQPAKLPGRLEDYLKEASLKRVEDIATEVPETRLWRLALDQYYLYNKSDLGVPRRLKRWLSLVRIWSPWLAPRHGQDTFTPKEEALLSSFLRWDGLHLVILPVSGINDVVGTLKPDSKGHVIWHSKCDGEYGYKNPPTAHVLIAVGRTFEAAIAAVMYEARKMVSGMRTLSEEARSEIETLIDERIKPEWMENWYDGLTYCTWNALGQNLNQQKIFDALDTLKANDIGITNLIIDDNWQSLDNSGNSQFKRGMTEFEANKEGFPKGLKYTVTTIRDNHPNIKHVAVWHALFGYWGGISPNGTIAKEYKTKVVRKQDGVAGGTMTVVDADDAVSNFLSISYPFLRAFEKLETSLSSVRSQSMHLGSFH